LKNTDPTLFIIKEIIMIVYKVTNMINGKVYIGKTKSDLKVRKAAHYQSVNRKSKTNFHRALSKWSRTDFKWEILGEYNTNEDMDTAEINYIKEYDTYKSGYNMTKGGDGGVTYQRGDELYERIKHKLGKWKNGNPGATEEAIAKRVETFSKKTDWASNENHGNYGHSYNKGILIGVKNPMYGKTPTNARKVECDGVVYDSVELAARELGVHKVTIRRRCLNEKNKNYKYVS
jgi:group I intron endonuclease